MIRTLYEDNHLLVVVKPPNMPVQADSSGDEDLLSLCKSYIKEKYNKPGEVYLGLVHRLDRPAGGVMVFARTSKAASRLSAQFKGHGVKKRYAALTAGKPKPRAELNDFILRAESFSRVVPEGTPEAKRASLSYFCEGEQGGLSLLNVALFTGRHHQIRVQCAAHGMSLYGDQRYNPEAKTGEQLALWAYSLELVHPTLQKPLRFTALPEGVAWKPFENQLRAMEQDFSLRYMDEELLVLGKGANLETCAEDSISGDSLQSRAESVFGALYPVHRLDANTTGLVLFARTPEMKAVLDEAIKTRAIHKFYRCIVKGPPEPPQATLNAWLIKESDKARVRVLPHEAPGAKDIATAYRTLGASAEAQNAYELEIELLTGRTHQIRAHLAFASHPLLGDDKYGDREWNRLNKCARIHLCACRLEFSGALSRLSSFVYPPFWDK